MTTPSNPAAPFIEFETPDAHALGLEWNYTDRADRLYWTGHRLFSRGFFAEAAELFERATHYDRAHYNAWVARVEMLVLLGRLAEAAQVAEDALGRYGRNASLGAARGHVFLHQGDLDAALSCVDIATRNDPESAYAWLLAGEARLRMKGGFPYAQQCFERALTAFEPWPYPQVRIGLALLEGGYARSAVDRLEPIARANPDMPLPWVLLGDSHRLLADWRQSFDCYRHAARLVPELASLREALRWRNRLAARVRYALRRGRELLVPPEPT